MKSRDMGINRYDYNDFAYDCYGYGGVIGGCGGGCGGAADSADAGCY